MRSSGTDRANLRRLQGLLALMIAWEILALVAELSFGGPLFKTSGEEIGGLVGARSGLGGLAIVPLSIYAFVLFRGPSRYGGLLWFGVLEQGATALLSVYHLAIDDVTVAGAILPLVGSMMLLVLLLALMPRGVVTTH